MPDEVVTMVTIDNGWYSAIPQTTILTAEQQAYFLFGVMALFVIGLGLYFYWIDKKERSE